MLVLGACTYRKLKRNSSWNIRLARYIKTWSVCLKHVICSVTYVETLVFDEFVRGIDVAYSGWVCKGQFIGTYTNDGSFAFYQHLILS